MGSFGVSAQRLDGTAELHVGFEVIDIQSPFRLSTHFTVRTRTGWRYEVYGHEVEIVKVRPRVWGGVRANSFTVAVDGQVVARASGK